MKFFPFFVSRIFVIACVVMVPGFASAEVEFKARGHWMWGFNVGNVHDQEHSADKDRFQAVQRLRTIFEFAASPQLGGAIQLEMGKTNWGQAHSGGAIGADSVLTKLRHAWLDWTIPRLDTRVRMGLQPVNMPSFVNGSPIFSEDTAAIVISQNFTENIESVFFWARASAANENPGANSLPPYNEMDFFGLAIPFSFDKIRFTPYGMFANVGINSIGSRQESGDEWVLSPYKSSLRAVAANLTPVGGPDILANPRRANQLEPWGSAWWGGIGGKLDFFEPFSRPRKSHGATQVSVRPQWMAGLLKCGAQAGMARHWRNTSWTGWCPGCLAGTHRVMMTIPGTAPNACQWAKAATATGKS